MPALNISTQQDTFQRTSPFKPALKFYEEEK